jgi:hypothetical protein
MLCLQATRRGKTALGRLMMAKLKRRSEARAVAEVTETVGTTMAGILARVGARRC